MTTLEKAKGIVTTEFNFVKAGYHGRYQDHCFRVGDAAENHIEPKLDDDDLRIIGLLHDLVEDTDWTFEDLRREGFSERIIAGVAAMTHGENVSYFSYVQELSKNPDARKVKLRDLADNMNVSRIAQPLTGKHLTRLEKYNVIRAYLLAIENNEIPAASTFEAFDKKHPGYKNPTFM